MLLDNCYLVYFYCYGDWCLCKDGIYSNGVICLGLYLKVWEGKK